MGIEMGLWRVDGEQPVRLVASQLPTERMLEDYLEADPSLLGERLLLIGRQVPTAYGTFIDLLAVDAEGTVHVLELKRDRTPREVLAQVLDYGSWVSTLDHDAIVELAEGYLQSDLPAAFEAVFGEGSMPETLNEELRLTVVASELDASSERIVTYLRTLGVPVNVVFFRHLEDEGRRYLARTWLADPQDDEAAAPAGGRKTREPWNGTDWYVSFGEEREGVGRRWEDARRLGFVSAGGGAWYSRSLRALPVDARIHVNIPSVGYVGVGEVLGEALPAREATVLGAGGEREPFLAQTLEGSYLHAGDDGPDGVDLAEWVVPVRWLRAVPREQAYWELGLFANQHSACKLRRASTIEKFHSHFGLT